MTLQSKPNTDDVRIREIKELVPPAHVFREFPAVSYTHLQPSWPDSTWAALPRIVGLNAEAGRQATGGDRLFYLRLLRMFVANHADDGARIRQQLADGEAAEAQRIAHTLKGMAATIGAEALLSLIHI